MTEAPEKPPGPKDKIEVPDPDSPLHVYAYIRHYPGAGDAWKQDQHDDVTKWCERKKCELLRCYLETDEEEALELAKAMKDFKVLGEGSTHLVVSRSMVLSAISVVQAWIDMSFERAGYPLIYVWDDGPADAAMQQCSHLWEHQAAFRVGQMNAAKAVKREEGTGAGGRYGQDEEEREILGEILGLKNLGYTLVEITKRLNNDRRVTRRGRPWSPSNIRQVLASCKE